MDKTTFIKILNDESIRLKHGKMLVETCVKNPSWISILLNNMNDVDDKNSKFSARVFELACRSKIEIITPHLNDFFELLIKVKLEGSIRSCAKICELLMVLYFTKNNLYYKNNITKEHLEKIIEASFDWMIGNQKTAVKAYSMQTLYLLGTQYDWIHPELVLVIEKTIPTGSTGYKNRGRKVLKAIETQTKLKL